MARKPTSVQAFASRLISVGCALFASNCLTVKVCATPQEDSEVLTNACAVLSLSVQRASEGLPVVIRGVVTASEPNWGGRFFIQDSTMGVFVENIGTVRPAPGDLLEVRGESEPGAYAPYINKPHWQKLGTAPLPPAKPVSIEQLMSGAEDGQRVEVSGIVRSVSITDETARRDQGLLSMDIVSGGYRFHAYSEIGWSSNPQAFVGSRVRVRGTAAASFNASLRRLITTKIFVPIPADIVVEKPETSDPFQSPILPIDGVAQYRTATSPGKRVHLKGMVTYQKPGEGLFLQDASGGLRVQSRQLDVCELGEVIEVAGFPDFDHFLPVLQDATFRKTSDSGAVIAPKIVTLHEIEAGLHHADLVTLEGVLIDRVTKPGTVHKGGRPWTRTLLTLQSDGTIFTSEFEAPDKNVVLSSIPIGSTIRIKGICVTETGEDGKFKSLQVLLRRPDDVEVIKKPSWFTPQRLLISLAILLAVSMVAVSWTVLVSRKNSALSTLILEKEAAQDELLQAHNQLEERVKERTAQLKFQITARKESELQSKATLAERTRLAQELHDTLGQTLTGVALQLDTTAKLFEQEPAGANRHLEVARNLIAQSQTEVRHSVWNLRCRALEQFDLPSALTSSSRQLTDGTSIHVAVTARGQVRPLPEIIEENLLRIAQEALTNVIKHSGATSAEIELVYGPGHVLMHIKDNGKGFVLNGRTGPDQGHFGLLGISERIKRIRGEASVDSVPEMGTTVKVKVPLDPGPEIQNSDFVGARHPS